MSSTPTDYGYDRTILPDMIATARRQLAKDRIFVKTLAGCFMPGPILEIGAGCGQMSELLIHEGFDVTASDIQPFLVEYMQSLGLRAMVLDATSISRDIDGPYDNIFSQSISTLINPDLPAMRRTYESVAKALKPGGRFVFILPSGLREGWSRASDHVRLADAAGLRLVRRFRHQALPSPLYARLPVTLLRAIDGSIGRIVGVRWVFVFELPTERNS